MSEDLEKENECLKKRVAELEKEVEKWKETLEKYKESCRFQMQQLIDYNDSLKEQLMNTTDFSHNRDNELGEFVSEDVDRFTDLVFSPSTKEIDLKSVYCIDNIHSSNIISVVPWEKNDHVLFSSDVTKRIVCSKWYPDEKAEKLCEVTVSAPCCCMTTLFNGTLLIAGCMDGMVYTYSIEAESGSVKSLRKLTEMKLHEKAVLRFRSEETSRRILSTSYDNTVCLSTVSLEGVIDVENRYYFRYTCDGICFCPKHKSLIIAERNQPYLNYISIETQERTEVPINHIASDQHVSFCITDIQLMHDEEYVVTLTDKGMIVIYKYGENAHIQEIHGGSMLSDSYYNGCIAVDDREKNVISICADNAIRVYSMYSGKEVKCLTGHTKTVRNMFYQKDIHSVLYTCSYDHTIRVWAYSVCSQTCI